ncbi:MAG: phage protein Gp37 [Sphingomonas sp.]
MIAAIELAMLARIRETALALGISWGTLHTFPDDWEAYLESDAVIQCPAAWVVFTGWQSTELLDDHQLRVRGGSFGLMIADENKRPDEQYQRHGYAGNAGEPGSYKLILAAVASLAGQTLGLDLFTPLDCGPLRPVAPTAASSARQMSRYSALFTCDFPLTLVGDGVTDPAELLTLHANWDIPALGDPIPVDREPGQAGVQLPDDFHADATSILSLGDD